ncbi:ATP-binding protein [Paenibacillus cymbidii]|uniref:ATP-binding protein n=1 Tax=Paenibacillus cymbidii TaxID=1639034 RepID=UPI001081E08C|nr:ATP-binding protein [Paenibacillus cymbidii]
MRIGLKVVFAFGTLLASLLVVVFISLVITSDLQKKSHAIMHDDFPQMKAAWTIKDQASTIAKSLRNYVLTRSNEVREEEMSRINAALEGAASTLAELDASTTDPAALLLLADVKQDGAAYVAYANRVLQLAREGKEDEATTQLIDVGRDLQSGMFDKLDKMIALTTYSMEQASRDTDAMYDDQMGGYLLFVILFLIIGTVVSVLFSRSVSRKLIQVSSVMDRFASQGDDLSLRLSIASGDEIGMVARSFNTMADNLRASREQEREWLRQTEESAWHHKNLSHIQQIIQSSDSSEELARRFMQEIAPMLGVVCAVFYVAAEEEGDSVRFLLAGTYAVPDEEKTKLKAAYTAGDGPIGEVIGSGRRMTIGSVDARHIRFSTSLSLLPQSQVIIEPLRNDTKVEAVLELVVQEPFSPVQERLLEQAGLLAALTLNKLNSQLRIARLLKEAQLQAEELLQYSEELHVQQEELAQINAELEEQTASLQQSESQLLMNQQELEEANAELESRAKQLIAASAYKSEFLANMSHELRTPLNSMLILTKLLTENREGNMSGKQIEYAQTVYSSSNDLLALINQILDLARVESGKMQVTIDLIETRELEEFVKRNFAAVAQQKGLEFTVVIAADVPDVFHGDLLRLRQMIHNLLSNAFKFTERGKIVLSIQCVDHEDGGRALKIAVSDTGIGIPVEKLDIIFNAFAQADGTTSRKYGGTGLGLSICRELAHLLGGEIAVASTEHVGSVFTLLLPIDRWGEKAEPADQPDHVVPERAEPQYVLEESPDQWQYSFAGQTVLIVDDDIRNVFALSSRLESYGIHVLYADNGEKGIAMLTKHTNINLVLMDVMMPGMDGYEATRRIRTMARFDDIPVIMVSAKAMQEDRDHGLLVGASDYLTKPIDVNKLLALLKIWLNKDSR